MLRRYWVAALSLRSLAIAGAAIAVLLASPGLAQAGKTERIKTTVAVDTVTSFSDQAAVLGNVGSKDKRCLDNRRVKVVLVSLADGKIPFDTARTGKRGGWLGVHASIDLLGSSPFSAFLIAVAPRKLKRPGGRTLLCKGAKSTYPLTD